MCRKRGEQPEKRPKPNKCRIACGNAVLPNGHRVPHLLARPRLRDWHHAPAVTVRSHAVDQDYLNRRMTEERQRAADADNAAAREAHLEMAEQYRRQIQDLGEDGDGEELRAAG